MRILSAISVCTTTTSLPRHDSVILIPRSRSCSRQTPGFASGRSARSLTEGRSLALRERERGSGPGERSRPHPTSLAVRSLPRREPPPSLRSRDYSRRELLGDGGPTGSGSTFDRGTGSLPRRQGLRSRRAKSPEVTEGGGARRGSEARSEGPGSGSRPFGRAAGRCAEGAGPSRSA
jgi:hypothetical protein